MGLIAKDKGGGNFKLVPAGTHVAVCTMVADMGVQPSGKFRPKEKIYIRWELPNEIIEWQDKDGNKSTGPMVVGKQYTLSLSEKANLRKDLESWRGKIFTKEELDGFDIRKILGKACMIGVVHNRQGDKTYANISTVMGLSKGIPVPAASSMPLWYSIDEHDENSFQQLPNWLQEAISHRVSNDRAETRQEPGGDVEPEFNDDIPF